MLTEVGETAEVKGHDIIFTMCIPVDKGKAPSLTTMQGGHREPKIATAQLVAGLSTDARSMVCVRTMIRVYH